MSKTKYNAPAVRKATELIELLSKSTRPLGLSEIARGLNTNKNMCLRILVTLEEQGWLSVEDGPKYRLSLGLFRIASRPVARLDIVNEAFPLLRELWLDTGVNVYMGIPHKDRMLRVVNFESTGTLRISNPIGTLSPLCAGAGGMALLAHYPKDRVNKAIKYAEKHPQECSYCAADAIRHELEQIRQTHLAIHVDAPGSRCVASPVFDHTGDVVAAIASTVPAHEYSVAKLKKSLGGLFVQAAIAISRRMGWSP